MPDWRGIWDSVYLGNSVEAWVIALGAFVLTFTALPLFRRVIAARRRKWREVEHTPPAAIELTALLIARTNRIFLWVLALWFASTLLYIPNRADRIIHFVTVVAFWFQAGLWGMAAVRYAIERRGRRAGALGPDPAQ
jgi:hypothetical protein